MEGDYDALNFPYIRIRDVEWLKKTLLIFPHVARISPTTDAPEDKEAIRAFCRVEGRRGPLLKNVNLDDVDIWHDQQKFKARLAHALEEPGSMLIQKFGQRATLANTALLRQSAGLWDERLASRTFQMHGQKIESDLLKFLTDNQLAWNPRHSDGRNYVEMHPLLGQAVMASLAFACAKAQGMQLVTEFPKIYGRTVQRSTDEMIDAFLEGDDAGRRRTEGDEEAGDKVAQLIIYQHANTTALTPERLAALSNEWQAIAAFKAAVEDLASDIPATITDPDVRLDRYKERADRVLTEWTQSRANLNSYLKEIFEVGAADEMKDGLNKIVENAFSPPVQGAILGGITTLSLLGVAAGMALGLVYTSAKAVSSVKRREREHRLRYLTMTERAGVSYAISS